MTENNPMIIWGDWRSFLSLNGEKLLLVKRRHPFVIIAPIFFTGAFLLISIFSSMFLFVGFFKSIPLFIATSILLVSVFTSIVAKTIIDWYFHLYILTTRKLVEVWYTPLASHAVNGILLDQVNCTEIDVKTTGFFNELLGIGDINISFDRPTHQEEFVMSNVQHSHELGVFLTQQLMDKDLDQGESVNVNGKNIGKQSTTIWLKERHHGATIN